MTTLYVVLTKKTYKVPEWALSLSGRDREKWLVAIAGLEHKLDCLVEVKGKTNEDDDIGGPDDLR